MAANSNECDADIVDRKLKRHYGIQDCYVCISRLSDSIFLAADGKELYKYGNKRLKYSTDECSETESDISTSHSESNEYDVIDILDILKIDSYPENYFENNNNCCEEKPFSVHYSNIYINEIVRNIYDLKPHHVRIDLSELYNELIKFTSDFTDMTEAEFRTRIREGLYEIGYQSVKEKFKAESLIAAEKVLNHLAEKEVDQILNEDKTHIHRNTVKLAWSSWAKFILNKHIQFSKRAQEYRKLFYKCDSFVIVRAEDVKYARKAIKRQRKLRVIVHKEKMLTPLDKFNSRNDLLIESKKSKKNARFE